MTPLKIAIVAHGRFHAFDLARALLRQGHQVRLYTNYPKSVAERFGVPRTHVETFLAHGVMTRIVTRVGGARAERALEARLHAQFGRWVERRLRRHDWDVVHSWSGVSEEIMTSRVVTTRLTLLMRGSAHIDVQSRLLQSEETRVGHALDRPSDWMRARERREYDLADGIIVLSSFARASFIRELVPAERLSVLPLGVDVSAFTGTPAAIKAREHRILRSPGLRVLYVGAVSYQKGFFDLAAAIRALRDEPFEFVLVGHVLAEVRALLDDLVRSGCRVSAGGAVPQSELPAAYAGADLFVFPTIQDGFAMVLSQAIAAGLPIIASANSAAPDLVREGRSGWIVPAGDTAALVERLRRCASDRAALARVASAVVGDGPLRDWDDVARDFVAICRTTTPQSRAGSSGLTAAPPSGVGEVHGG